MHLSMQRLGHSLHFKKAVFCLALLVVDPIHHVYLGGGISGRWHLPHVLLLVVMGNYRWLVWWLFFLYDNC
jgi:hypothetical protein